MGKTGAGKTRGLGSFYPHTSFYLLYDLSSFQARRIFTPHLIVHFISCLSRSRLRTAKRVCGTRSIKGAVNDSVDGDPHREPALRVVVAKLNVMARSPVKLVDGTRSRSCVATQDLEPRKGKQEN